MPTLIQNDFEATKNRPRHRGVVKAVFLATTALATGFGSLASAADLDISTLVIAPTNDVTVTAGSDNVNVTITGEVRYDGNGGASSVIPGGGEVTNAGIIQHNGTDTLTVTGNLTQSSSGLIDLNAGAGQTTVTGALTNNGGRVEVDNALSTASIANNSGYIQTGTAGTVGATGAITNGGILDNRGGVTAATMSSSNHVINHSTGTIGVTTLTNTGLVSNDGTITATNVNNNAGGFLDNEGQLNATTLTNVGITQNAGTIAGTTTTNTGHLVNETGGNLNMTTVNNNDGTMDNHGTVAATSLTNAAAARLNNFVGGALNATTLTNNGAMNNTGSATGTTLTNTGSLTNEASGSLSYTTVSNNAGTLTNEGSLTTTSYVFNAAGATLNNRAGGTINGASVSNHGLMNNSGTVNTTVYNYGTLNTDGTLNGTYLYNYSGEIVNASGAINSQIYNYGDFNVLGDLAGNGSNFSNVAYSGATLDVTGGDLTGLGLITINAGTEMNVSTGRTVLGAIVRNYGTANIDGTIDTNYQNYLTTNTNNGVFTGSYLNVSGTTNASGDVVVQGYGNNYAGATLSMDNSASNDTLSFGGGLNADGTFQLDADLNGRTGDEITITGGGTTGTPMFEFDALGNGLGTDIRFFNALSDTFTFDPDTQVSGLPIGGTVIHNVLYGDGTGDLVIHSQVNPAIAALASNLTLTLDMVGSVVNRPTSPFVSGLATGQACSSGGWGRAIGGKASLSGTSNDGSTTYDTGFDASYMAFQAGWDSGCFDGRFGGWDLAFGGSLGMAQGRTSQDNYKVDASYDAGVPGYVFTQDMTTVTSTTTTDFDQKSAGAYIAGRKGKFTGDFQLRYDNTSFSLTDTINAAYAATLPNPADLVGLGLSDTAFNSTTTTASTRINYAIDLNQSDLTLIPTAGFSLSQTKGGAIAFPSANGGGVLEVDDFNSRIGYVGGTLARTVIAPSGTAGTTYFTSANFYKDFSGDRTATFTASNGVSETITTSNLGGFGEISLGVNHVLILEHAASSFNAKQLNASIRLDTRFGDAISNAYALTGQVRFSF